MKHISVYIFLETLKHAEENIEHSEYELLHIHSLEIEFDKKKRGCKNISFLTSAQQH